MQFTFCLFFRSDANISTVSVLRRLHVQSVSFNHLSPKRHFCYTAIARCRDVRVFCSKLCHFSSHVIKRNVKQRLPVIDEICARAINFVRSCLHHQSSNTVSHNVTWYSVMHGCLLGVTYLHYSAYRAIVVLLMSSCHATHSIVV